MKKPRKPLRKVSKKREGESRIYAKRKKVFLSDNKECFCCGVFIMPELRDLHHLRGRAGKLFLDERFWRMTCQVCHNTIHRLPAWAIRQGLLGGKGEWGVCPK